MATGTYESRREFPRQLRVDKETADLLGISLRHLRKLIATGEVPTWRAGNRVLIDPKQLRRWIDAGGSKEQS